MAIRKVPSEYLTIAAAVSAAVADDIIELGLGYQGESAVINKNNLTVTGGTSNTGIVLTLSGGVTRLTLGGTAPISVIGAAGTAETVTGNDGDNTYTFISGQTTFDTGRDSVNLGAGEDTLIVDFTPYIAPGETLYLGSGLVYTLDFLSEYTDLLSYSGVERINATGHVGADNMVGGLGNDTLNGASGSDTLSGGGGADSINGGGANDQLSGGAGADTLDGGTGEDTVSGGDDGDFLSGGSSSDLLSGDLGADTLDGGDGNDTLNGGADGDSLLGGLSFDQLNGGAGSDTLDGGDGGDTLNGGTESDTLLGGRDNDTLYGDAGADSLDGGDGADTLNGGTENDTLSGGLTNDRLDGGVGDDSVSGGDGNDVLVASAGQDTLDGGEGLDALEANWSAEATGITLAAGVDSTGLPGGTSIVSVERFASLITGSGADVITTSADRSLSDSVNTGGGDDTVTVLGGATALATGQDMVDLGAGDDLLIVDYSSATDAAVVTLSATSLGSLQRLFASGAERLQATGGSANDFLTGGAEADTLMGGGGDDDLLGAGGADSLDGGGGNDRLRVAGTGASTVDGGAGNDSLRADWQAETGAIVITAGVDNASVGGGRVVNSVERFEQLLTGAGADVVTTSADRRLADSVNTGAGDDAVTFLGGANAGVTGHDTLVLGTGTDTLVVDFAQSSEQILTTTPTIAADGAFGQVTIEGQARLTFSGVDRVSVTGGSANDVLKGSDGDDTLNGGGGDDILRIGVGADHADGGAGFDALEADFSADSAAIVLSAGVDNLAVVGGRQIVSVERFANLRTGSGNDVIVTSLDPELADIVDTGAGDDTVTVLGGETSGATGLDQVALGSGSDLLTIDYGQARERVIMAAPTAGASGSDGVLRLGGGVRVLFSGADRLNVTSGVGADELRGGAGADSLNGGEGTDRLEGGSGADSLSGGDGADTIDGGVGADTLVGGAGDDLLTVDDAGDVVLEASGGGNDTLVARASYAIAANIETMVVRGTGLTGTGSAGADLLVSRDGANTLVGLGGADVYVLTSAGDTVVEAAGGGSDVIVAEGISYALPDNVEQLRLRGTGLTGTGTAGADALVSEQAGNSLIGLGGDDLYMVQTGDTVTEAASGGYDSVVAYTSFTIPVNVELLIVQGAGLTATGSAGSDTLLSRGGANTLIGLEGDDTYVIDGAGQTIVEAGGGGYDVVVASVSTAMASNVELLILRGPSLTGTGTVAGDLMISEAFGNTLLGGAGSDLLLAGLRSDTLTGGSGADAFALSALSLNGTADANRFTITDFDSLTGDVIDLTRIDAVAGGGDDAFTLGALAVGQAGRLQIDQVNAGFYRLSGDVDGDGVADFVLDVSVAGQWSTGHIFL